MWTELNLCGLVWAAYVRRVAAENWSNIFFATFFSAAAFICAPVLFDNFKRVIKFIDWLSLSIR